MQYRMIIPVLCMLLAPLAQAQVVEPIAPPPAKRPLMQVALLLDNSGSMSGLIEQAKSQLWSFINEFATSRKNGMPPIIQVALFTYGNPPPKMITPLTDDLDLVSEKLFAITINGGSEHCGEVIQSAVSTLSWSNSPEDLKIIFIAGNEPFTQGEIDYRDACRAAIGKGILVNTIHCGAEAEGLQGAWKDGALLADGRFLNIDHNRRIVHITAPQDEELARLGREINVTYVCYGEGGEVAQARQSQQDANAASVSSSYLAKRAVSKGSVQYNNANWDLVDAVKDGKVKIESIKEEHLPQVMRKMTADERVAYVEEQTKKRDAVRKRIAELNAERQAYVAAKQKELAATSGDNDLESAMITVVREQATVKQFIFRKP